MTTPSARERLHYRFDNYMSHGTIALIGDLAVISIVIILLAAFVIWLGTIRPEGVTDRLGFFEAAWESMMRTLDPGTMGGDTGWGFRIVIFIVTLGGIFIISALIGALTSGIGAKTEDLRKSRSKVIESGHTVIQPEVQIIAVSRDDDTIHLSGKNELGIEETAIRSLAQPSGERTNILVLGWNADAAPILQEIDHYIAPGSQITVVANSENAETRVLSCCAGIQKLQVSFVRGDFSDRTTLESLKPGDYQRILLLACSDDLNPQRADALTLVTLLHLRDLADRKNYNYAIVSQILDVRNRSLAEN